MNPLSCSMARQPMTERVLDGAQIPDRAALHDALSQVLPLPEWYGRNLDALMDCLTDLGEETRLHVTGAAALADRLGPYGAAALRVLRRAEAENPRFSLVLEEAPPASGEDF